MKPSKCHFAQQEFRYLGYVVTPPGLRVDPAKIDDVTAIKISTNKSQLKAFLGLTSYRCFVLSYAARIPNIKSATSHNGCANCEILSRIRRATTSSD